MSRSGSGQPDLVTDARADPDHPPTLAFPAVGTTTGPHEAETVPQDERGTNGHAEEGRAAGQVEFEFSLPRDNLAVVRRRIGDALHPHDDDSVHDVQLVTTELAWNACDHANDPRHLLLRREIHPDRGPELVRSVPDATDRVVPGDSRSRHGRPTL